MLNSKPKQNILPTNAADICRQLVALMLAGLPAKQARETLREQIEKLTFSQLRQFEAVWSVAIRVGGPPAIALNRLADVFDLQFRREQEVELAYSAPKATAKLVMGLPAISLVLAQLVGMDPLGAITKSIVGAASIFIGLALLATGHYWSKRLLANALPTTDDPGAHLDCVAIGLQAGLPLDQARATAEQQLPASEADRVALDEAADLSRRTGAGLSEILLAAADRARQLLNFEIANRIARLSVRLMIPLGVAVLPAFVFIAIVPIAISLLSK